MSNTNYEFENFSTREGFNRSLGHFQSVSDVLQEVSNKVNLADLLIEEIELGNIKQNQLSPIIYALLVDKFSYLYGTINVKENVDDFSLIQTDVAKWKAFDLVGTYIHPELGFLVFNPKNAEHWKTLQVIKKNEIVNIYIGTFGSEFDEKLAAQAIDIFFTLLSGKKKSVPPSLLKGNYSYSKKKKPPVKAATTKVSSTKTKKRKAVKTKSAVEKPEKNEDTAPAGPRRMTPLYSVPVTNELFHNGNVEAWKRVIKSYTTKHPQLEVYIFYEGERIHDINALFKWGKVKHGSAILFAVAGDNVKDVAKLQRYLMQGASPRFEDFLRFPVNTVLNLF